MPRRLVLLSCVWMFAACGDDAVGPRGPKRNLPAADAQQPDAAPVEADGERARSAAGSATPSERPRTAGVGEGRVTCPGGTVHQGSPPPTGTQSFCLRRTDDGGVRHGPYREWTRDGTLVADGSFDEGQRSGTWTEYYDDGAAKALTTYAKGIRDGPWKTWFADGQLSAEGTYRDGRKDGVARFYYDDGTKKAEGTWRDDVKVGVSTNWHPDGSVMSKGSYVDGNKSGPWLDVDADGTQTESVWDDGVEVPPS